MNPIELKRQILLNSDQSGIRKRIRSNESGINNDDILEMGAALEEMVKMKGWAYIEAYILKNANPIGLLFDEENPVKKGESRALIKLIQYVDQIIKARNDILDEAASNERKAGS